MQVTIYPLDRDLNRTWYVEFVHPITGKRLKKYGKLSKFHTIPSKMAEATRVIENLKKEFLSQSEIFKQNDPELLRLINKNFDIKSTYLAKKTIDTYFSKLKEFAIWYRNNYKSRSVNTSGVGHSFVKYLQQRNLSATTINAYRATIKTFWPKEEPNPFDDTYKLRESRSSYLYFSEEQQSELINYTERNFPQLALAIKFQYYCLLRPDELRVLKVGDIIFDERKIKVRGVTAKHRKTMFCAIPDEFYNELLFLKDLPPYFYVLGQYNKPGLKCRGKKFFPELHRDILKKFKYNTEQYKFYSWKHTGAVMFYLATGDIKALQQQGRWHSMDMVNEYLKNLGVMDISRILQFPKLGGTGAKVAKIAT